MCPQTALDKVRSILIGELSSISKKPSEVEQRLRIIADITEVKC